MSLLQQRGQFHKKNMIKLGVLIPVQNASWEADDNFRDLLQVGSFCHMETCKCPDGNYYSKEDEKWAMILTLASVHVGCQVGRITREFNCQMCKNVQSETKLCTSAVSTKSTPAEP